MSAAVVAGSVVARSAVVGIGGTDHAAGVISAIVSRCITAIIGRSVISATIIRGIAAVIAGTIAAAMIAVRAVGIGAGGDATDHRCPNQATRQSETKTSPAPVRFSG